MLKYLETMGGQYKYVWKSMSLYWNKGVSWKTLLNSTSPIHIHLYMDNAVQTIHTTALERVDAEYTVKSQVWPLYI